jgi:hypothetical protein
MSALQPVARTLRALRVGPLPGQPQPGQEADSDRGMATRPDESVMIGTEHDPVGLTLYSIGKRAVTAFRRASAAADAAAIVVDARE